MIEYYVRFFIRFGYVIVPANIALLVMDILECNYFIDLYSSYIDEDRSYLLAHL